MLNIMLLLLIIIKNIIMNNFLKNIEYVGGTKLIKYYRL